MSIDTATLELRIQRLFPDLDWDQAVVELLLEHAQRNLVKYRAMARQFEAKYDNDFETMRETVLTSEPAFEVEQDYFDWEMAVTGVTDMQEEIEQLKQLRQGSRPLLTGWIHCSTFTLCTTTVIASATASLPSTLLAKPLI